MSSKSTTQPTYAFLGTWKLKSLQTTSEAIMPIPQQAMTVFAAVEDGIRYASDTIYTDGQKTHAECLFKLDGQRYTLSGSLLGETWSARQTAPDTYEAEMTRDAKVTARARAKVAADRRTMTTEWEVVPEQGATLMYVTVAERQGA